MKTFARTPKFKRQAKALFKKHFDSQEMEAVLEMLSAELTLPAKYHDHALVGDMQGYRECHIEKNWLLVYRVTETEIILVATGSHDDLFK